MDYIIEMHTDTAYGIICVHLLTQLLSLQLFVYIMGPS